jgi:hypothetical protein
MADCQQPMSLLSSLLLLLSMEGMKLREAEQLRADE